MDWRAGLGSNSKLVMLVVIEIKFLRVIIFFLCLAGSHSILAQEKEWVSLTGDENLRAFMSGLIVERQLAHGWISRGVYSADGSGKLTTWGATFPRTWKVNDKDQVCITANRETLCYGIEQSSTDPTFFRSYDDAAGEWVEFQVIEGRTRFNVKPARRGDRGSAATPSAAEISAELNDPNTPLGILTTLFDYTTFDGSAPDAGKQSAQAITFQPSLPYPLNDGKVLFFRPSVPLILDQPVADEMNGGFQSKGIELGDIGYDASMGFSQKLESGKNIFLAGVSGAIPTATDKAVGSDQWLLGPLLGFTAVRKWGSIGGLLFHQWDVAGEDSFDTNITGGQYVYNIHIKNSWQLTGSPTWSYNHNADSSDALTLPLAIGLSKAIVFKGRPWTMSLEYWNYIATPDAFGPKHQVRLSIAPIVPLPWKGNK